MEATIVVIHVPTACDDGVGCNLDNQINARNESIRTQDDNGHRILHGDVLKRGSVLLGSTVWPGLYVYVISVSELIPLRKYVPLHVHA